MWSGEGATAGVNRSQEQAATTCHLLLDSGARERLLGLLSPSVLGNQAGV